MRPKFPDNPFFELGANISAQLNKQTRDADTTRAQVVRYGFHLTGDLAGTVTRTPISSPDRFTDVPTINDKVNGLPYCIYYGVEWWHDNKTKG